MLVRYLYLRPHYGLGLHARNGRRPRTGRDRVQGALREELLLLRLLLLLLLLRLLLYPLNLRGKSMRGSIKFIEETHVIYNGIHGNLQGDPCDV